MIISTCRQALTNDFSFSPGKIFFQKLQEGRALIFDSH